MSFTSWLNDSKKIILFDGAMGTQVMQYGIEAGKIADILNIEKPEVIQKILLDYYNAGADMVQTCTFNANKIGLHNHHIEELLEQINMKALENSTKIRPQQRLIVGDIGPSGEFRSPIGTADESKWIAGFREQVKILEPGIDVWHIETISDLVEVQSAISAIREVSKKPIMASMTYKKTKRRGFFTIMGDSVEKCVTTLENEGVDVIGTNCTLGSHEMIDLAKEIVSLTKKPVLVKPNAGQPQLEHGLLKYDQPVQDFVADIKEMITIGAKIVGGCCGTTPKHIEELKIIIDSM